jgi:hypothetical protein
MTLNKQTRMDHPGCPSERVTVLIGAAAYLGLVAMYILAGIYQW